MAWELLPSPTRPSRAQAPALIPGPSPTGRPGWKQHGLQIRRIVTVFLPGCSLTALCALGETESGNRGRQPVSAKSPAARHCNDPAHSPLRRDPRPSSGRAPLGSSRSPARVYRVRSGPARLLKTTRSSQGSTLPHRGRPARQVYRSRTGSACNIHAISPLRRVLRSSIGRPPLGSPSYKLGFIGATQARPACFK